MTIPQRVVVKLGGSLLDWSELPTRFEQWLSRMPRQQTTVIVGGGKLVDDYRIVAVKDSHDPVDSHWHCIDLMSKTAAIASDIFNLPVVHDLCTHDSTSILDVRGWMKDRAVIPCSWAVTSDSIAALIAGDVRANELVLLKSTLPDTKCDIALDQVIEQCEGSFIDEYFGRAISHFTDAKSPKPCNLRFVNLRDDQFAELCFPITI